MKSYKQLITGIVIGATAASAVAFAGDLRTFVATEADFPVVVNGSPVTLDMPVVTIEERTYLPLRAMGDILGVSVDWDGSQAVVTTEATPEPTVAPIPEDNDSTMKYTSDGLPLDSVSGYLDMRTVIKKLESLGFSNYDSYKNNIMDINTHTIIIADIPLNPTNNTQISPEFYESTILPWIESLTK